MKARLPFVVSCVAAGCALAWVQEALGDTYRWTGDSGADLNMSTPGNWYNETAGIDDDGPTPEGSDTDVLVFGAVPADAAFPCLDGDRRLNALVFESDAPSYMINGTVAEDTSNKHMLIFGGENPCIIQNSDAVQTFKNNRPIQFRLDKDLVIYGTGTGELTFRDLITGEGGLRKVGKFNIALAQNNSYKGMSVFLGGGVSVLGTQAKWSYTPFIYASDAVIDLGDSKNNAGIYDGCAVVLTNSAVYAGSESQLSAFREAFGSIEFSSGDCLIEAQARVAKTGSDTVFNSKSNSVYRLRGATLEISTSGDQLSEAESGSVVHVFSGGIETQHGIVPWGVANVLQPQGGFLTVGEDGGFDEYAGYISGALSDDASGNFKVFAGEEELTSDISVNSLYIDTSAGEYRLSSWSGSVLSFAGGPVGSVFSRGSSKAVLSPGALRFEDEAVFFTAGADNELEVESALYAATVTKSLDGTLLLGGALNVSNLVVGGGTVVLDGVMPSGDIVVHGGATLRGTGEIVWKIRGGKCDVMDIDGTVELGGLGASVEFEGEPRGSEYVLADYSGTRYTGGGLAGEAFRFENTPECWRINYAGTASHPDSIVFERMPATLIAVW